MRTILDRSAPVLREKARSIPLHDIRSVPIRTLIRDMKKLLAKEPYGVALAAPQVGASLRLFVVAGKALAKETEGVTDSETVIPPDQVYINPILKKLSRAKKDKHEGCLSVRGMWGEVPRAEKAMIEAHDERGKKFTCGASGFLAHIFQHEMDHLDGILYTDKATNVYAEETKTDA